MKLEAGKMSNEHCGTRVFWAPEVCHKKYSFPVDVWAVGVVLYGLLDGKGGGSGVLWVVGW